MKSIDHIIYNEIALSKVTLFPPNNETTFNSNLASYYTTNEIDKIQYNNSMTNSWESNNTPKINTINIVYKLLNSKVVFSLSEKSERDIHSTTPDAINNINSIINNLSTKLNSRDYEMLINTMKHIENNYDNYKLGVHDISKNAHQSIRTIQMKIKKYIGLSPHQLITLYRLEKSVPLLKENSLLLTNIAYRVGFSGLDGFQRAFKAHFGTTPSNFRRMHKDQYKSALNESI